MGRAGVDGRGVAPARPRRAPRPSSSPSAPCRMHTSRFALYPTACWSGCTPLCACFRRCPRPFLSPRPASRGPSMALDAAAAGGGQARLPDRPRDRRLGPRFRGGDKWGAGVTGGAEGKLDRRGPSSNGKARTAGCYRADAPGSAAFAPPRQAVKSGDGPRGDNMGMQSSCEAQVEAGGIGPAACAYLLRAGNWKKFMFRPPGD